MDDSLLKKNNLDDFLLHFVEVVLDCLDLFELILYNYLLALYYNHKSIAYSGGGGAFIVAFD